MTYGYKLKIWDGECCEMCAKPLSRECSHYDGKYFCSDSCLGQYLVEKIDDEIEWVDFRTLDEIKLAEAERKAEY